MKYLLIVAAVFLVAFYPVACTRSETSADTFTHPAYAYSIEPPPGYSVRPFIDALGVPYYVLTDDPGAAPHDIKTGIWIIAYPIASDDELDATVITPMISALIQVAEPGLKISEQRTPAKLGTLDGVTMEVHGQRRVAGAWRGQMYLAVHADHFLLVHHGAAPEQFDQRSPRHEAALRSLVAPLPIQAIREGTEASKQLTEEEAKQLLKQCTPRVDVPARGDVKDEDSLTVDYGSGTGFLIHPDGYVITNRHVVDSNAFEQMTRLCYDRVVLNFDKSLKIEPQPARVVAVSQQWDLALLKIEGDRKWPVVPLADPSRIKPGHRLLVAGWPEPSKYGKDHVTIAAGKVLDIQRDSRDRPLRLLHDAFTRPGSSGGPVFDRDLGAIVAAHYMAYVVRSLVNGVWEEMPGGYKGGVPVSRLLWEFPQVAAHWSDRAQSLDERRALVAYFLLQERFGAAFIEAGKALAEKSDDGMINAYVYRMYAQQRDTERAQASLLAARRQPESNFAVMLLASLSALENDDTVESMRWNAELLKVAPTHPAAHLAMARAQVASGGSAHQFIDRARHALGGLPNPELEMLKGLASVTGYLKSYAVIRLPPRQPPSQQVLVDAIVALEKSIELWPARQGLSWANLAILHAVDGRKKKAREFRDRALRSSPNDAFTRLAVAHLDLLNGDFRLARRQISEANQIRSMAFGLFLTGWANLLEAREVAQTDLQKARQLAALGKYQIGRASEGPERYSWWRGYAASVSSGILR